MEGVLVAEWKVWEDSYLIEGLHGVAQSMVLRVLQPSM